MRSLYSRKPDQPRRRPSAPRWLVTLFVSLLVSGTVFVLSGLPVLAATPWTVTPSALTAGDTNCPINSDGSWTCSVTLTNPSSPGAGVPWSSKFVVGKIKTGPGVTFTPSSGSLSGGETTPISIHINRSSSACQSGSFAFLDVRGRVLAQATWTCTYVPIVMTVSPTTLTPPSDPNCNTNEPPTCTVTLANPVYSTGGFNWKATTTCGVQMVTPPLGTLTPNESTPVTFSVPFFSGTVTFTATPTLKGPHQPPIPPVTVTINGGGCG